MLIPSGKPLFENVSSKEYYSRAAELGGKGFNGCIHVAFPDFEEAILFSEGKPSAAVHQAKRWLTVGDDLLEPAENKTIAMDGKMAAYELPRGFLDIFIHMQLQSMVETELGPYTTAGMLLGHLEGDKSTCVLKIEDAGAKAYAYLNFGKLAGAVLTSPEGRSYDEAAVGAMGRFKEHAYVAIYFTEPSSKYLKSKAEARVGDVEAAPPKPSGPQVIVNPFPMDDSRPMKAIPGLVQLARPATEPPVPELAGLRLVVALSASKNVGIAHRSKLQALEAFEEGNVAWVDGRTLALIHARNASIVLPNGREYAINLVEAPIEPPESRFIILPRKLRGRLSVGEGTTIELKASS